jgi:hypothetical protein
VEAARFESAAALRKDGWRIGSARDVGAGVAVDLHSDGDLDDTGLLPGHDGSPQKCLNNAWNPVGVQARVKPAGLDLRIRSFKVPRALRNASEQLGPPRDMENRPTQDEVAAWPALFIVGAPRCGTTSMSHALGKHPDIAFSKPKEPHFFSALREPFDTAEARTHYLNLFFPTLTRSHRAIAEGSVSTLYDHGSLRRILRCFPQAKFVVMVRCRPIMRGSCSCSTRTRPISAGLGICRTNALRAAAYRAIAAIPSF